MKTTFKLWMTALIFLVSGLASGCSPSGLLGPNVNLNLVVPLGFGGAPGVFNPFGIVQAIVNAMLGEALNPPETTTSAEIGQTRPPVDSGTIGTVVS